jgi:hypothetical protein
METIRQPTSIQVRAVYEVMRLLRRDRVSIDDENEIWCDSCLRTRHSAGSATYGSRMLCNGCATDFELQRLTRSVRDVDDYLSFKDEAP